MCCAKRWILRSGLLVALVAVPLLIVGGQPAHGQSASAAPESLSPTLAILPLANYSAQPGASEVVAAQVKISLASHRFSIIDAADLRATLRRYRIRSVGAIDNPGTKVLATSLDADYLLLGSVDTFGSGDDPQLAFSLRLLDAASEQIIWAKSMAGSGSDYTTVLGLSRVTSLSTLTRRLVSKALADLQPELLTPMAPDRSGKLLAVVPFDNLEPNSTAGDILSSRLLTTLVRRDVRVAEPGEVSRLGRNLGRRPRGAIDLELLLVLADSLEVDFVLTGTVDHLVRSSAGIDATPSRIGLGARLVDTRSGKIIAATELQHQSGANGLLGSQAQSSLGRLLPPIIEKLIDELHLIKRTDFAKR